MFIGVLTVLIAIPAAPVSAGINVWTSIGPEGGVIYTLAIDPTTPSTLYAGTTGGLFKSTNSGGTWNAANNGLTSKPVSALAIDSSTPSTLYAGTTGGLFKSINSGGIEAYTLQGDDLLFQDNSVMNDGVVDAHDITLNHTRFSTIPPGIGVGSSGITAHSVAPTCYLHGTTHRLMVR